MPVIGSRGLLVLVLLAVLAPDAALAKKRKRHPMIHDGLGGGWFFVLPVRARLGAGYLDGDLYREAAAMTMDVGIAARPEVRLRTTAVNVALDLSYRGRETFGASLADRRLGSALSFSARLGAGFRAGLQARLRYASRPGWADHYRELLPTDRYSHLDLGAGGTIGWRASRTVELALFGDFEDRRYAIDPEYDAILAPTHLTPSSSSRITGGGRARGSAGVYRWSALIAGRSIDYRYAFARDAGTGLTHAGPGGLPPNPLQRFVRLDLRQRNRLLIEALASRLLVGLYYQHNADPFRGYYTWNELSAEIALRSRLTGSLALEAGYRAGVRLYGDGSRQAGEHDRQARFQRAVLRLEYGFLRRPKVLVFLEGLLRTYSTNFADYPLIDWDYRNLTALGGVELAW